MSNIDKQALRNAAKIATPGPWYVHDKPCEDGNYGIDTSDKEFLAEAVVWWGFARQSIWREEDAKFIAAANPATVLALLDELEAKDRQNALDVQIKARLCRESNSLHDRLREAESRIAELKASHSNLREAMAGIHNTITGGGAYTPLAAILNASKRAYEESAVATGTAKGE